MSYKEQELKQELGNMINKMSDEQSNTSKKEDSTVITKEKQAELPEENQTEPLPEKPENQKLPATDPEEEIKALEKELLENEPEFELIFDNIKSEKHENLKKAKEKKERLIKKIQENRSQTVSEKLEEASKIDNMNVEELSAKDPKDVLKEPDGSANPEDKEPSYFKNIIDDEYENIIKISSGKFFRHRRSYRVLKNCNLEEILFSQCEQVFAKKPPKKKKQNLWSQIRWAKLENLFFEENKEAEEITRGISGAVREYKTAKDEVPVSTALYTSKMKLKLNSVLLFILLFVAFIMVYIKRFYLNTADVYGVLIYIASQLFTLLGGMIVGRNIIKNGLSAIFSLKCNTDTALTLACVGSVIHSVVTLFNMETFNTGGYSLYCIIPLFGLFINTLGKLMIVKRIAMNFKHLKFPGEKYAIKLCSARDISAELRRELKTGKEQCIAYKEKFDFTEGFLAKSSQPDICEVLSGKLTYIGLLLAVLVFTFKVAFSHNFYSALCLFSAVLAIFIPICATLVLNFRFYFICKKQLLNGNILLSNDGVEKFSSTKHIVLKDSDIYYGKAVSLYGMKMFNDYSPERLTVDTAAVFKSISSPIYGTFKKMIKGREDILPLVDSLEYYEHKGIEAYVQGRKILIGNRVLLSNNSISPPPKDIEDKYEKLNKYITYIAVNGRLCAMLVIDYHPTEKAIDTVQTLENNMVGLLVNTYDPNINARLISEQFKILYSSVKMQGSKTAEIFKKATQRGKEKNRVSHLISTGKMLSIADIISSAAQWKRNNKATAVIQILIVLFLFCFISVLGICIGSDSIKTFELFIAELIASGLLMAIPWIDRR